MPYAQNTSVSTDKSRAEIESLLRRFGAQQFVSGWDQEKAMIGFTIQGRMIKMILDLPRLNDSKFQTTPSGRPRNDEKAIYKAWEQACREKWRAFVLGIKAKLVFVESGITSIEEEFLAHITLPDGSTVGEYTLPQVDVAYKTGKMPALLPWVK